MNKTVALHVLLLYRSSVLYVIKEDKPRWGFIFDRLGDREAEKLIFMPNLYIVPTPR